MYAFYITGQVCHILKVTHLQVTGSGFIISANIDDRKAIQVHVKQPLRRDYRTINYPEILTISADIPIAY